MTLFDFDSETDCDSWVSVNDVVMGGSSHSRLEHVGESTAAFSGVVSLEHSGGFASVWSPTLLRDLRRHSGLMVRVRGDGKQYTLSLKTPSAAGRVQYQAVVEPPTGEWMEMRIPFSEFVPMFRGARVHDAAPLDITSVHGFGVLISGRQEGAFRLLIDRIGVYP